MSKPLDLDKWTRDKSSVTKEAAKPIVPTVSIQDTPNDPSEVGSFTGTINEPAPVTKKDQGERIAEDELSLWWKKLMVHVTEKKVTDIIFNAEASQVFCRQNTELVQYEAVGRENYERIIMYTVPKDKKPELDERGETDFATTTHGRRLRVNVYKTMKGMAAAYRPLPNKSIPWKENGLSEAIMRVIDNTKQGLVLVAGPTGSGKSLAYGTPVIKYDGSIVPIETIKVSDLLMGVDSKPRKVTNTQPGVGEMFTVTPKEEGWLKWKCNDCHILSLAIKQLNHKSLPVEKIIKIDGYETIDINIEDYVKLPEVIKEQLLLFKIKDGKVYTSPFGLTPTEIGNYYGILLDGDGRFLLGDSTVTHNSTTICSMLEYVNEKHPYHIITIEDPIEYIFQNKRSVIDQREVNDHTKSFESALRASLRENPDIIFVGEIRDYLTARTALMAADTGHLVFGTLHTRRVYSTISRLLEMAPESNREEIRAMLSNALALVVCQRLLQKKTGGIFPCREVMMLNPAISALIKERKEKNISSQLTICQSKGMLEWGRALELARDAGIITKEEAEKFRDSTEDID